MSIAITDTTIHECEQLLLSLTQSQQSLESINHELKSRPFSTRLHGQFSHEMKKSKHMINRLTKLLKQYFYMASNSHSHRNTNTNSNSNSHSHSIDIGIDTNDNVDISVIPITNNNHDNHHNNPYNKGSILHSIHQPLLSKIDESFVCVFKDLCLRIEREWRIGTQYLTNNIHTANTNTNTSQLRHMSQTPPNKRAQTMNTWMHNNSDSDSHGHGHSNSHRLHGPRITVNANADFPKRLRGRALHRRRRSLTTRSNSNSPMLSPLVAPLNPIDFRAKLASQSNSRPNSGPNSRCTSMDRTVKRILKQQSESQSQSQSDTEILLLQQKTIEYNSKLYRTSRRYYSPQLTSVSAPTHTHAHTHTHTQTHSRSHSSERQKHQNQSQDQNSNTNTRNIFDYSQTPPLLLLSANTNSNPPPVNISSHNNNNNNHNSKNNHKNEVPPMLPPLQLSSNHNRNFNHNNTHSVNDDKQEGQQQQQLLLDQTQTQSAYDSGIGDEFVPYELTRAEKLSKSIMSINEELQYLLDMQEHISSIVDRSQQNIDQMEVAINETHAQVEEASSVLSSIRRSRWTYGILGGLTAFAVGGPALVLGVGVGLKVAIGGSVGMAAVGSYAGSKIAEKANAVSDEHCEQMELNQKEKEKQEMESVDNVVKDEHEDDNHNHNHNHNHNRTQQHNTIHVDTEKRFPRIIVGGKRKRSRKSKNNSDDDNDEDEVLQPWDARSYDQ